MKNNITIGSKIGYLQEKNGSYKWVEVVGFTGDGWKMREKRKHFLNEYEEKAADLIKYLHTPSINFKDGRTLLRHKGCNKLY